MYRVYQGRKYNLEQPGQEPVIELLPSTSMHILDGLARDELFLLAINRRLAGPDVGIVRLDKLGLLDELPGEKGSNVHRDSQVRCDEGLVVEVAVLGVVNEDIETACEGNQDAEEQSDIRAADSQRSLVWDGRIGHPLCFAGADEADMGNEERYPRQHCTC